MQIVRNVDFMCPFVNFQINKAVVGSGHGDAPKYVGKVWHHVAHGVSPVGQMGNFTLFFPIYANASMTY